MVYLDVWKARQFRISDKDWAKVVDDMLLLAIWRWKKKHKLKVLK